MTKKVNGWLNLGIAAVLSPFLCLIPFIGDCAKDTVHFCEKCGNVIATVKRID